jgi:broad specificity phosphatase PhoE
MVLTLMSINTTAAFYSSTRGYAVTSSFTKIILDKSTIIVSSPGRSSFTSHLSTILRANQRSLSSSTVVVDEYEKLKKSRQFRIHARLHVPSSGNERNNIESSTNNGVITKIVHFQRHAQGTHNEIYQQWTRKTGKQLDLNESDSTKNPLFLPNVIDAPLTPKGRDQCMEQQTVARALEGVALIIMSPLVRCLQTAHITFEDYLPNSKSTSKVKWIAHEGIREELGLLLCNKRSPLSETQKLFPNVDFTHAPFGKNHDQYDTMWEDHARKHTNTRESIEDMSHRCYDFLVNFVRQRHEREIAVVAHSALLYAMTNAVLDVNSNDRSQLTPMFGQAEIRSVELTFVETNTQIIAG